MNESNPSARLAQKLFGLASKKYGAPYCGSPLIDDALSQGVRFWVSGIAVGGIGIPGMCVCNFNYIFPGFKTHSTPPNSEIICGQNMGTKVVCGMILFFKKKAMLKI